MPQGCAVANCFHAGGHTFPKDKTLLQQWLEAIRRPTFKPSVHARVCKKHFHSDDYMVPKKSRKDVRKRFLKKYAVPSIFEWNEANCDTKSHAEKTSNLHEGMIKEETHVKVVPLVPETDPLYITSDTVKEEIEEEQGPVNSNSDTVKAETEPWVQAGNDIARLCRNEDTQCSTCSCKSNQAPISVFCIENLRDDNYAAVINFYTGLNNYNHFMCVFNLFGDDVNYLKHHPSMQTSSSKRVLTPCNEFYLILIKLKRNMCDLELSFNFQISKSSVGNIFATWMNYLYSKFKDFHLWAPKNIMKDNLFFKSKRNPCIVVIDCSTTTPEDHVSSPATNTSANCLKMLIGISASGCISYVSKTYAGTYNDGQLFSQCGIINVLQKGNAILGEQGQHIVSHSRISSERIPVERVTELGNTYNILNSKFEPNIVPLGNKILFVCFMLKNLHSSY